jgi:ATP-binding cassette subfamily B protein
MKDNTKKTIEIYWHHAFFYKKHLTVILVSSFLGSILSLTSPILYKKFFDILTRVQAANEIGKDLTYLLITIACVKLFNWFCWRLNFFSLNFFDSKIMADLGNMCFRYLHQHSYSYFANNFGGSIVKRVKGFTSSFEVFSDQVLMEVFPQTISVLMITFVLSKINILFGIGVIAWVVLFLIINWIFIRYKLQYDLKRTETESKLTGLLADTVANSTNVKLFNGYKAEVNRYFNVNDEMRSVKLHSWNLAASFQGLQRFLLVSLEIAVIYFALVLWQKGLLTVGDFVLIQSYFISMFDIVTNFSRIIRRLYESLADANEMTEILETPHEILDIANAKDLKTKQGKIEFKNVGFEYDKNKKIFEKFNLVIKPRERVAIVGTSGAGKTTIVKLLLRLHDINNGKILIDGQDISRVTQESLRKNISLVPQDPILFHRSLMENIRYGKPEATDKEVIAAAKLANCDDFIKNLSNGYDTYVGERGIKLSGGERQRVAIARAILRNAPILILDEATSSLDSNSENLIQEALEKLMKDKTVIVIAHRLSTIKKSDRILVASQGKIIEEGTHSELINLENGIYKSFWNLQIGGFIQQ